MSPCVGVTQTQTQKFHHRFPLGRPLGRLNLMSQFEQSLSSDCHVWRHVVPQKNIAVAAVLPRRAERKSSMNRQLARSFIQLVDVPADWSNANLLKACPCAVPTTAPWSFRSAYPYPSLLSPFNTWQVFCQLCAVLQKAWVLQHANALLPVAAYQTSGVQNNR
jgi:hypothetical protein